ncbi:MAG TPA: Holliday junction branch migration protein RuvA [Acidimicrobiales bacterium]
MIGSLRGEVVDLQSSSDHAAQLIVDVHGVGYLVTVSARHAVQLKAIKGEAVLAIHTHVREGAIQLYGFPDSRERNAFELLLTAHGVGPALAMAILGALPPHALFQALATGDLDALTAIPGVGKRTAQRLQLELGQHLALETAFETGAQENEPSHALRDVHEALAMLGYGPDEVHRATKDLDEQLSTELLLREALNALAPTR